MHREAKGLRALVGRRLLQLVLPPDWTKQGVYSFVMEGGTGRLRNRCSGKAVDIEVDWQHIVINNNYSEMRACLTEVGGLG